MKKITFECETITPMFCYGADDTPDIRPPSIKGALRFWWRAINGDSSIEKLRGKEAEIFGGSGEGQGKSKINIRIELLNINYGEKNKELDKYIINSGFKKNGNEIKINILDYLAYGIVTYNKELRKNIISKGYIKEKSKFNIIVKYQTKYEKDILNSFYAFFEYGNLGSKSRNGFGGIKLLNNSLFSDFKANINFSENIPAYTAFSKKYCLFETESNYDSWCKALGKIGEIYREARLSLEKPHNFDERQYISLPLVAKNESNITEFMKTNRKSKSYFLKVIKEERGFKGRILFLPSTYGLKDNDKSFENYSKMNRYLDSKMKKIEVAL